jgi:hypothetical protein
MQEPRRSAGRRARPLTFFEGRDYELRERDREERIERSAQRKRSIICEIDFADSDATCREAPPLSAPAIAGEGDHWSSRSERTEVEGAPDSQLRCRYIESTSTTLFRFTRKETGKLDGSARRQLSCNVEASAPSTTPSGWSPSPAIAVADEHTAIAAQAPQGYPARCRR